VQTANGYDVAWKVPGADEYTVWSTDSNGNYIASLTGYSVPGTALEALEATFHQDLNGDGTIGPVSMVIQVDGSTSLTEFANKFYLYDSTGSGPTLKYGGVDVVGGEFGTWAPIGAVQTANGYDVAWKVPGADEYTVWSTDSNGNYIASLTGYSVPGTDYSLEALEATFHQDLNGDGVLGIYASSTFSLQYKGFAYISSYNAAYESADSLPSLVQTGANSIEATLSYGIDVATSQVVVDPNYTESLNVLGKTIAEAESLGLSVMVRPLLGFLDPAEVAPYSVGEWRQDYQPTDVAAFFASYKQMLIAEAEVAQQSGAQMLCVGSELDQLAGPQYLPYWTDIISSVRTVFDGALTYSASWNTASEVSFWSKLNYEGIDCYVPLSNEQNPTLHDLINGWLEPATQSTNPVAYAVIGNQSPIQYFEGLAAQSGKPLLFTELGYANDSEAAANPSASGSSPDPTLQAALYEAFFQAWAQSGSSSLKGTYFWEWDPNGSPSHVGPAIDSFSPQNSPAQNQATAGFETQILDGAIDNSSNIEVVGTLVVEFPLTLNGTGTVTMVGGAIVGSASGEPLENAGNTIFGTGTIGDGSGHLSLDNASGTIEASGGTLTVDTGTAINNAGTLEAATGATLRFDDPITGTGSQTIGTGAKLEIAAASSEPVIFAGSTGTLILDHSSTFSGQIFDFTGNGSLSDSDQIDLRDIVFGSGTTALFSGNTNGGTLTVTDAQHDIASISLAGDYENSTFTISSDGNGGTLIVDPPMAKHLAKGAALSNDSELIGNATVTVSPRDGGSGNVADFMLGAVNAANGPESTGGHLNLDSDSIAQTITESGQTNGTKSTAPQSVSVTVGGPGNDAFVFKPGFGADIVANTTSLDTFGPDGFLSATTINQLPTLLTEAHSGQSQSLFHMTNSSHDTMINLVNHDSITQANVQLPDLHVSSFIIHSHL
jgi:Tryptophan-rich Synechocystis species C-terminal domain